MKRLFLLLSLALCVAARYRQGNSRGGGRAGGGGRGGGRGRGPAEDTEMSTFLTRLWNDDAAKARYIAVGNARGANTDVRLNIGGRTNSGGTNDAARNPLFRSVRELAWDAALRW